MDTGILNRIRQELQENIDEKTRDGAQHFFKEAVKVYGVKTPAVDRIAARYFRDIRQSGKKEIFALCEELLKTDYCEEAFIAFDWAYRLRGAYEPADFERFEDWLSRYVNNWAKCDTFCNHSVGAFIERFPGYIERLKKWTGSENRWLRRAAAVSLIIPARRGKFLEDVFDIADILLLDEDDLVQKGYGWMLKEASRLNQRQVFDYVVKQKAVMPRTALRYAIEKMPKDMRRSAMKRD
jgi:3-methyladenine DNA glycosylase AlkD